MVSENIKLSFEVHDFIETKRDILKEAIEDFLLEENIVDWDFIIDFIGQEGYLAAYMPGYIIVRRTYKWLPEMMKRWEIHIKVVHPEPCRVFVDVEYE